MKTKIYFIAISICIWCFSLTAYNQAFVYMPFDGDINVTVHAYNDTADIGTRTNVWDVQNPADLTAYQVVNTTPLSYPNLKTDGFYVVGGGAWLSSGVPLDYGWDGTFADNGFYGDAGSICYKTGGINVIWFSALIRTDIVNNTDYKVVIGSGGTAWNAAENIEIKVGTNKKWALKSNAVELETTTDVVNGNTHLIVIKITFSSATQTVIDLYMDPASIGGSAPGSSSATITDNNSISFRALSFYPGSGAINGSLDEIRFGKTFADVTPLLSIPVTSVTLDQTTLSLAVGQTATLTPTIAPSNASNKTVSWSTSDIAKATISNGLVTAVAVGTSTITVTTADGAKTATCDVTVTPAIVSVASVSILPTTASIVVGNTQQLTETVLPADATDKTVSWSSSNTSAATVNTSGLVTAVAVGNTTITVTTTDGAITATCAVTVTAAVVAVASVSLLPVTASIVIGNTRQLTETLLPADATDKTVSWSSSNTSIATVSISGLITAVATGNATITATTTDGAKTATCAVTVTAAVVSVASVSLIPLTASIVVGNTQQLTETVLPTDATDNTVSWSSSNTSVATVSTSGLVTAVAAGNATITVTTTDGAKTATCAVTVTDVIGLDENQENWAITVIKTSANSINISVSNFPGNTATFSMISTDGMILINKKISLDNGNGYIEINGIQIGMYLIKVSSPDSNKTIKYLQAN